MTILYTDGGVIQKNPSLYGGTWAYVLVKNDDETIVKMDSGVVTRAEMGTPVTNNQMEYLAVIRGLLAVPTPQYLKEIRSDSNVTLGRFFKQWSVTNIPKWMIEERKLALKYYDKQAWSNSLTMKYTLLAGHPTEEQLRTGIGKNGNPVSKWNVLADKLCNDEAYEFLQNLGE